MLSNVEVSGELGVGAQTAERTAQLRVLAALAILALLLTGVGIHGLLAFTVAQRNREIGVRISLGAQPSLVARMIVGEAGRMLIAGLVPGIRGRAWNERVLFGVRPDDPVTLWRRL